MASLSPSSIKWVWPSAALWEEGIPPCPTVFSLLPSLKEALIACLSYKEKLLMIWNSLAISSAAPKIPSGKYGLGPTSLEPPPLMALTRHPWTPSYNKLPSPYLAWIQESSMLSSLPGNPGWMSNPAYHLTQHKEICQLLTTMLSQASFLMDILPWWKLEHLP